MRSSVRASASSSAIARSARSIRAETSSFIIGGARSWFSVGHAQTSAPTAPTPQPTAARVLQRIFTFLLQSMGVGIQTRDVPVVRLRNRATQVVKCIGIWKDVAKDQILLPGIAPDAFYYSGSPYVDARRRLHIHGEEFT